MKDEDFQPFSLRLVSGEECVFISGSFYNCVPVSIYRTRLQISNVAVLLSLDCFSHLSALSI